MPETPQSPETENPSIRVIESIVQRAKEIIAGRAKAQHLVMTPPVQKFLDQEREERERAGLNPTPTEKAQQQLSDWLNLQAHYGGHPAACFTTADGFLTVLAWGNAQVAGLLKGLTDEERKQVVVEYPDTLEVSLDGTSPRIAPQPEPEPITPASASSSQRPDRVPPNDPPPADTPRPAPARRD
jgi:hypothetical protein